MAAALSSRPRQRAGALGGMMAMRSRADSGMKMGETSLSLSPDRGE